MPETQTAWERTVELTIAVGERILAPIERFIGKRSLVGDATFFPPERFPWVAHIEQNWQVILDELQSSIERGRGLRFGVSGHLMVKPKKLGVARNPKTGQVVPIPPGRTVRIKPSKALGTRSRREKTHYE